MGAESATTPPSWAMAAYWPAPLRAIACQTGVVEASDPHCTVLTTMPFWRARDTDSVQATSSW